jgi:hypothetical protein
MSGHPRRVPDEKALDHRVNPVDNERPATHDLPENRQVTERAGLSRHPDAKPGPVRS